MQNEEGTSSAESLESLQYANQHQSNSVLDPRVIAEQSEAFDNTAMGGHGQEIKRSADVLSEDSDDSSPSLDLSKRKKTKGRVKIEMKFINNKLRRYTTFSKRKTGIMKKAYELSTLTGTQVMLLVASETGHVYTFATRKLQPMITSEAGKALIQTCLNSPDPPVSAIPNPDQRMSATGYEETDLSYSVNENEEKEQRMFTTQQIENSQVLVTSGTSTNAAMTGMTAMPSSGHSFPITTYIPPSTLQQGIKGSPSPSSYSVQAMPGGGFTTIFTPGNNLGSSHVQLGQSSVPQGQQQVQILSQQVQLQRTHSQSQAGSSSGTSTVNQTGTVQSASLSQDGQLQQNHEHNVESTQGGSQQAIVVPIAQTNQDGVTVSYANVGVPSQMMLTTSSGQIPIMYYTPQSGVVSVSNLPENSDQSGQQSQLNGGDTDAGQQTLPSNTIQVQQDMQHIYVNQTVVTETSGTQTQEEIQSIVNEHSSLGAESDSAIDKSALTSAANQDV